MIVDVLFCPGHLFCFNVCGALGPFVSKVRVWASNLFFYIVYKCTIVFRANFRFISNCYLCSNVVSYRAIFFVLIFFYVKRRFILINYVS